MGKHAITPTTPNRWIPSPAARRWLYGIAAALGALLVGYGIMTASESGLWLALAGAILGGVDALAFANTPDTR